MILYYEYILCVFGNDKVALERENNKQNTHHVAAEGHDAIRESMVANWAVPMTRDLQPSD
jgi:hypothetical protein